MGQWWGEELRDWNRHMYTIDTRLPWRLRGKKSPVVQEIQVRSLGQEDPCLGNSVDKGAWWSTAHGVAKQWDRIEYSDQYTVDTTYKIGN